MYGYGYDGRFDMEEFLGNGSSEASKSTERQQILKRLGETRDKLAKVLKRDDPALKRLNKLLESAGWRGETSQMGGISGETDLSNCGF